MYINAFRLCHHGDNNVGDALNNWLWPQLMPSIPWNTATHSQFIGIGSLLNHWLYPLEDNIVFTTGVGYGSTRLHRHIYRWHLYALRGPLSAQALEVDSRLAITDGAYLIRRTAAYTQWKNPTQKTYNWGFIPHHATYLKHQQLLWEPLSHHLAVQHRGAIISPVQSVETFIQQLLHCKVILSESLHGAILADALGIPWQPITFSSSPQADDHDMDSFRFKWLDWTRSIDAPYQPGFLLSPYHLKEHRIEALANTMQRLVHHARFYHSPERRLDNKTEDLTRCLAQFEQNYHAGAFNTHTLVNPLDTLAFGLKHRWKRLLLKLEQPDMPQKRPLYVVDGTSPLQTNTLRIQPLALTHSFSD